MYISRDMIRIVISIIAVFSSLILVGQYGIVDHWESAATVTDDWKYHVGTSAPSANWKEESFNDASWSTGKGGFGYGYSNLTTSVPTTRSLYLRKSFSISDFTKIVGALLVYDYDASMVAYINGYEFRRHNIGSAFNEPAHNDVGDSERKARLAEGKPYNEYVLRDFQVKNRFKNGNNVIAIQIHASSTMPTSLAGFFNFFIGFSDTTKQLDPTPSWFKEPPMYAEFSTLPIIRLTSSRMNDSLKIPGKMEITWNGKGKTQRFDAPPNYYDGHVAVKYRGNSTLEFPKKSIRVETQDSLGNNLNREMFGMPRENDWILYAPYTDKSLLRNYVVYDLARKMLEWAPRTQLVELFHNGYYLGVYIFMEKVKRDKNRVNIHRMKKTDTLGNALSGGYMTKVDWPEAGDPALFTIRHNTDYPLYRKTTFEHVEPEIDSLHPKQKAYIEKFYHDFEASMLKDDFADEKSGYKKFANVESFVDYMFYNEISKDIDSYRFSTYFYKNHIIHDGLMHMGPAWDYNLGFGNVDFGTEEAEKPVNWMFDKGGTRLWWFARLMEDPNFEEMFNCRWKYYRENKGVISKEYQYAVIDKAVAEMAEAADRNHYHWKTLGRYVWPNFFVGETYQQEIDFLKNWISERIDWIDENIPGECQFPVVVEEIPELPTNGVKLFPNPASDQFKVVARKELQSISVFDINGKQVLDFSNLNSNSFQIQTLSLNTGVYFVKTKLLNESGVPVVNKLVIQ